MGQRSDQLQNDLAERGVAKAEFAMLAFHHRCKTLGKRNRERVAFGSRAARAARSTGATIVATIANRPSIVSGTPPSTYQAGSRATARRPVEQGAFGPGCGR